MANRLKPRETDMRKTIKFVGMSFATVLLVGAAPAYASEFSIEKPTEVGIEYSPHINKSFPQQILWGDTHLHTTFSPAGRQRL